MARAEKVDPKWIAALIPHLAEAGVARVLDELRALPADFPEDQEVKWCTGQALLNAAVDAEEKGDLAEV